MAENLGQVDLILKDETTGGGGDADLLRDIRKQFADFPPGNARIEMSGFEDLGVARGAGGGSGVAGASTAAKGGLIAVAAAATAAVAAIGLGIRTLTSWDRELQATTTRLSAFSGSIAQAQVAGIIGNIQRDIRSARNLAPAITFATQERERLLDLIQPSKDLITNLKAGTVGRISQGASFLLENVNLKQSPTALILEEILKWLKIKQDSDTFNSDTGTNKDFLQDLQDITAGKFQSPLGRGNLPPGSIP